MDDYELCAVRGGVEYGWSRKGRSGGRKPGRGNDEAGDDLYECGVVERGGSERVQVCGGLLVFGGEDV